jgi:hypothetical protein
VNKDTRIRSHRERGPGLVMCATILGQAVAPLVGGKDRCRGRSTTSHEHRRCGTTGACRSGWRSPLLTGAASPVRIFLSPGVLCPRTILLASHSVDLRA